MKIHEPIGDAAFGPLFIRLALGSYFILAGLLKLKDVPGFVAEVQNLHILPPQLGTVFGIMLPYVEVGAGALLIIGLWTTLAALLTSLMLLSFVIAFGLYPDGAHLYNKDVLLLASSISLLYTGSGAWSIDRFRRAE